MNKFKLIRNGLLFSFLALSFTGCVNDDDYDIPPIVCNQKWEPNTNVPQIKALNATDTPFEITNDLILEGYVVSSDEKGNFFKSIVIQDKLENPTAGMTIELDVSNTYTQYPVGGKVLVNAKGLFVAKDKGTYKIGSTFDSNGTLRVGRMSEVDAINKVALACDPVQNVVPTTFTSINDLLDESRINTLIKLDNVQFQSVDNDETFYEEGGSDTFGGSTNRKIVDSQGNTIVLRTSKYADFAATKLPKGSGSIVAVLSAYAGNNSVSASSYQLFIRDISDVKMEGERFEISNGAGPVGGAAAVFNACLSNDFNAYSAGTYIFPEFINYAKNGDRYWKVNDYGGNKYLQLTAHLAPGKVEAYLIVPVNFDQADSFSFKSKDGYNNGDVLSVYYLPSYDITAQTFDTANLVDITSSFTISTGNTGGYGSTFIESGSYDLSSIAGKGAIVFGYKGDGNGVKTTMQLDDIKIVDNENVNCN